MDKKISEQYNPLVSIIVPIYNSYINLNDFLESFLFSSYKKFEVIVNNDSRSTDEPERLCKQYIEKGLNIKYIEKNQSMAQGRNRGADFSSGEILLHLDSDMKASDKLLEECVDLINKGFDALVIPEESFGTTFWAKCKWLEKKCYRGVEQIESVRCLRADIYREIGGHNEEMIFSEDKDLDIRVKDAGYKIGRTKNLLWHNEGKLHLLKIIKKKLNYAHTANIFAEKHSQEFAWQINILNRYLIYFRNIKYLFSNPAVYIGMIFMKTFEFGFGGIGYFLGKIKKYEKK
ncbi:MAG: glycosyltransferase [Patescibacteria group bacterium]